MKTFRDLFPLGEGSQTERKAGFVDDALLVSCPWIFVSVMFLSAPDMRPNFFDKQISHRGRVIQEGVIVQRRNMAESFELDFYSFADFSDRVPGFPCGHHIAGLALRLGVVRTGLSKTSVLPKAGLGHFGWPSNKADSEQGRNGPIRFFPQGLVPLTVLHDGKSIIKLHLYTRQYLYRVGVVRVRLTDIIMVVSFRQQVTRK